MLKKQYTAKLNLLHLDDEELFLPNHNPARDWLPESPAEHKKRNVHTLSNDVRQEKVLPQLHTNYKQHLKRLLKSLQESTQNSPNKKSQKQEPLKVLPNNFIRHGNTISVETLANSRHPVSRKLQRPLSHSNQNTIPLKSVAFLYGQAKEEEQVQLKIRQKIYQRQVEKNMFAHIGNFLQGASQTSHTNRGRLNQRGKSKSHKNALNYLLS